MFQHIAFCEDWYIFAKEKLSVMMDANLSSLSISNIIT
jgi:hypothetical protein